MVVAATATLMRQSTSTATWPGQRAMAPYAPASQRSSFKLGRGRLEAKAAAQFAGDRRDTGDVDADG